MDDKERYREDYYPITYLCYYPYMRDKARELGYALAIHGSMRRDLDLVAIPWTNEAADVDVLVNAMVAACFGRLAGSDNPTAKPHGRLAYSIHPGSCIGYIDLSIVPKIKSLTFHE